MKRAALLLSVLALVVMSAQPVAGKACPRRKKCTKKDANAKKGQAANAKKEGKHNLALVVKSSLKAEQQALAEWRKANGEKVKELTAAMKQARKDKDAAKTKEITRQLKELQAEQEKIQADTRARFMEMLTEDQQATWVSFLAYRSVMARLRKVKLSGDQRASVGKLCRASGVELLQCGSDRKGQKAKAAICKKLVEEVVRDVLTDKQREQLKKTGGPQGRRPEDPVL